MSSDTIVLYTNWLSACSHRVAIALQEANIEHERIDIDLYNKPVWFKDVNPNLMVPVLKSEGQYIYESSIINEYLNDRFPEKNLLPNDSLKRANIRFAIEFFGSYAFPEMLKYCYNKEDNAVETFRANLNAAFKRLNDLLLQSSATGPYFLGEQFSLADAAIAPFLLRLYSVAHFIDKDYEFEQVKASPRLAEFFKGVKTKPSIQETYCGDEAYAEILQKKYSLTKRS